MKRVRNTVGALAVAGLVLAGCGLPGSNDESAAETSTTVENGQNAEPEGAELTDGGGSSGAVPDDIAINEVARHPGGLAMHISAITFGVNEARVSAEFINGSTGSVGIQIAGGNRLRLVDDLGNEYNYVPPADLRDRNSIELAQGDTIGGDFVFVGPISEQASSLVIAANTYEDNPVSSDMADAFVGENNPTIVLDGIELSW